MWFAGKDRRMQGTDRGYAWVVVMAAFMLNFMMDGVRFSYGILYIQFLEAFGEGKGETAWIGSLMFGMISASAPLGGTLINQYGCRVTSLVGSGVSGVGFIISYFAASIYFLYFSFGIMGGVGFSLVHVSIQVALVRYFKRRRSLAIGVALCGSGIGGFAFNSLMVVLIDNYAWRGAILILSGIIFNGAVLGALFRPKGVDSSTVLDSPDAIHHCLETSGNDVRGESEEPFCRRGLTGTDTHGIGNRSAAELEPLEKNGGPRPEDNDIETFNFVTVTWSAEDEEKNVYRNKSQHCCQAVWRAVDSKMHFSLLKDPIFLMFAVSQLILATPYMIPFTFLPKRAEELGFSSEDVVGLMSALSISNTACRLLAGFFGDFKGTNRMAMFTGSVFMAAVVCLVFPLFKSYGLLVMYSVLYGMAVGAALTLVQLVIPDLFGDDVIASSYGLTISFRAPGNLLGSPIAGWLADGTGRLDLPFVVAGVLFLAGATLVVIIYTCRQCTRTCSNTEVP